MLISKGFTALARLHSLNKITLPKQTIRNSSHHWNYRAGRATQSKSLLLGAEIVQGIAWWWVLWHLWTEPGHVFGEFEYPDASKWTDEELGIPPL